MISAPQWKAEAIAALEANYFDMYRLIGGPVGCRVVETPAYLAVSTTRSGRSLQLRAPVSRRRG